jgi:SAM-dependent methyltransferase
MSWNDPATARSYERFYRSYDRYRRANQALIEHAALAPGQHVLDVGAGTGGTTELALERLCEEGRVVCVEPAAAMARLGRARLRDARVSWTERLPDAPQVFDRILCGAALWLLGPLDRSLAALRERLAPGGALCFNVPALYLGEPDSPGGGTDPLLLSMWARLMETRGSQPRNAAAPRSLTDADSVNACLVALGLEPVPWRLRIRFTQAAQRDWLKIPPISDGVLAGMLPDERTRLIDSAWASVDPESWRWEAWRGWTAWAVS